MIKKKILFVGNGSYRNLSDTYWRIETLKKKYDVTYLGFNENMIRIDSGFNLIEMDGYGNSILSRFKLLLKFRKLIKSSNYDLIIVNYFIGASLFALLSRRAMIDIRSSIIRKYRLQRILYTSILRLECCVYRKKIIISEGLRDYLFFRKKNTYIFPLGAQKFKLEEKTFENLSLLYVGTFNLRKIDDTIKGFYYFMRENPNIRLKYYLIGYGNDTEIQRITSTIKKYKLEDFVFFLGELRYPDFIRYFEICNVGISYVPITDYFNFQPPTKTFEYLMNGLSVIGTSTNENNKLINDTNGVLINDSYLGFKKGLEKLFRLKSSLNSREIVTSSNKYSWETIVNSNIQQLFS